MRLLNLLLRLALSIAVAAAAVRGAAVNVSYVIEPFESLEVVDVAGGDVSSDCGGLTASISPPEEALFGNGALRIDYCLSAAASVAPASVADILSEGTHSCQGATHLSLWFAIRSVQSGITSVRIVLADGSKCASSKEDNGKNGNKTTFTACSSKNDLEYYYASQYILLDDNGKDKNGGREGWRELLFPLTDGEKSSAWRPYHSNVFSGGADDAQAVGQRGNGVLELSHLRGWRIEFHVDPTPQAPVATGTILFDQLACVGGNDMLSAAFRTTDTYEQAVGSSKTWKEVFFNSPTAEELSNFSLADEQIRLEYAVEQREDWGGYTELTHLAPRNAYYNLSSATHISFGYVVSEAASVPKRLNLRFILSDSSDCPINCTEHERYYSFFSLLDTVTSPGGYYYEYVELEGDADQRSPFWLTGWSGGSGNGVLDREYIKGFSFELNVDGNGPVGSVIDGLVSLGKVRAEILETPEEISRLIVIEDDLVFFGNHFNVSKFFARTCKSLCSDDPKCLYGYTHSGDCFMSTYLTSDKILLREHAFKANEAEYFWSDTQDSRGDFCDKCACQRTERTIDCRGADLKILPKSFSGGWRPAVLDLRDNPYLVLIGKGALDAVSDSIAEIRMPKSMRYVSNATLVSLGQLTIIRFEGDEAEWEAGRQAVAVDSSQSSSALSLLMNAITGPTGKYSNICCGKGDVLALEYPAYGLTFCHRVEPDVGADAEYVDFMEVMDGNVTAKLVPSSEFMSEAAESVQKCAEYCAITQECRYFNFDGRWTNAESICSLLRDAGTSLEPRCCELTDYADVNKEKAGWVFGWPPQTRRKVNNARVIITPTQTTANEENGFIAHFKISLGSMPKRGAVWVEPALASSSTQLDVSFSPTHVVLYDNETSIEVSVYISNVNVASVSSNVVVIANAIRSCDVAFSKLSDSEILENNVFVNVVPPKSSNVGMITTMASLASTFVIAVVVAIILVRRRKDGDLMWTVQPSELRFDNPPICVGQGSFGRVLLAEYRGTMVAVKRVIPPRSVCNKALNRRSSTGASTASINEYGSAQSLQAIFNTEPEEAALDADIEGGKNIDTEKFSKLALSSSGWHWKTLNRAEYSKLKTDFITEMRHLSKMRHPCITTVMGAIVSKRKDPMLLMEYMDHGSLYSLLHNETVVIEGGLLLPILRDIAQGLRFLHAASPPVIHGDLKAANCLVDSKFRCKVADFGLSQKKKLGANGTPFWMAPELLQNESTNTPASDVYSFGITLYEVYSRKDPYEDDEISDPMVILRLVADRKIKKRPLVPKACPRKVCDVMSACLAHDPEDRPTFENLDAQLKAADASSIEPSVVYSSWKSKSGYANQERTNKLLYDVFPQHVAEALRDGRKVEPEFRDVVTIFFADIVGFTTLSSILSPMKVSDMLDRLYSRFDALSHQFDVFKVETIGDCYMAVTNLVKDQPDHAKRLSDFSIATLKAANDTLVDIDNPIMGFVNIRIGLHSGPVVANVVGSRNPRYCLFGDTVNTASRMESHSEKNSIHCSEHTATLLKQQCSKIIVYPRGHIVIKGKGEMYTYWVKEAPTTHIDTSSRVEEMPLLHDNSSYSNQADFDDTFDISSSTETVYA